MIDVEIPNALNCTQSDYLQIQVKQIIQKNSYANLILKYHNFYGCVPDLNCFDARLSYLFLRWLSSFHISQEVQILYENSVSSPSIYKESLKIVRNTVSTQFLSLQAILINRTEKKQA